MPFTTRRIRIGSTSGLIDGESSIVLHYNCREGRIEGRLTNGADAPRGVRARGSFAIVGRTRPEASGCSIEQFEYAWANYRLGTAHAWALAIHVLIPPAR